MIAAYLRALKPTPKIFGSFPNGAGARTAPSDIVARRSATTTHPAIAAEIVAKPELMEQTVFEISKKCGSGSVYGVRPYAVGNLLLDAIERGDTTIDEVNELLSPNVSPYKVTIFLSGLHQETYPPATPFFGVDG